MKSPAMSNHIQFHLPLPEAPAAKLSDDKQRELARALVELLVSAARQSGSDQERGGGDESEADE